MQHRLYIEIVNFDQALKEPAMSINKLISWITGKPANNSGESISYDAIFKGSSTSPVIGSGNFLPGLRVIENDVDSYFKEVFAGPVF